MSRMSELRIIFQDVQDITNTLPPADEEFIIEALVSDLGDMAARRIARSVLKSIYVELPGPRPLHLSDLSVSV